MLPRRSLPVAGLASAALAALLAGCGPSSDVAGDGAGGGSAASVGSTGPGGHSGAGGEASGGHDATGGGRGGGGAREPEPATMPTTCPTASAKVSDLDGVPIAGARICRDIAYDTPLDIPELTLDMYVPPDYAPGVLRPAILYLHGGGWMSGHKEEVQPHEFDYLTRGYFVFSIDYRLSPARGADHAVDMTTGAPPADATNIQDVKTAIQFIRGRYASFIDGDGLVAWGFSAGAHLAVLAGVTANDEAQHPELRGRSPWHESTALRAVVAQSPALDFGLFVAAPMPTCGEIAMAPSRCGTPSHPIPGKCNTDPRCTTPDDCSFGDEYATVSRQAVEAMLGAPVAVPATGVTATITPLTFVGPGDAALYTLSGTCDGTIPPAGARDFAPAATAKGADVTARLIEGAGHQETMDAATNPTADADVRSWLESRGLPSHVP